MVGRGIRQRVFANAASSFRWSWPEEIISAQQTISSKRGSDPDHLLGRQTIGVYPLLQDDTWWFVALDFDKKTWEAYACAFLQMCEEAGVPASLERSRSGNGGRVWIFFASPIPETGDQSSSRRGVTLERLRRCPTGHAFLAMPISRRGTLQQYVGRLNRLHESKRVVSVYDYVDVEVCTACEAEPTSE